MNELSAKRCPLNVEGPFYTRGDCLFCGAPEAEAPDLLAPLNAENYTTYFLRQPRTPEEVARACQAMQVCCVHDLRYGGTDEAIIKRLGNTAAYTDFVVIRDRLVFIGTHRRLNWVTRIVSWLRSWVWNGSASR